jgi:hypothetical protein
LALHLIIEIKYKNVEKNAKVLIHILDLMIVIIHLLEKSCISPATGKH